MEESEASHLRKCKRYIRRQQCTLHGCSRRAPLSCRRSLPLV
jgi:hypothetical protein